MAHRNQQFSLLDLQRKQLRQDAEYEQVVVVDASKRSSSKKRTKADWERIKREKEEKVRMERHLARKFLQRSGGGDEAYLNKVGYVTIKAKDVAKDNTLENVRKARAKLLKEGNGGWKELKVKDEVPVVKKRSREETTSSVPFPENKKKKKKILPFSKNTAWIEVRQSDGSSYYWNTLTDETRKKGEVSEWKYTENGALLNKAEDNSSSSSSSGDESESSSEEEEEDKDQEQEEKPKSTFSFAFKKPTKGPTPAVFQ